MAADSAVVTAQERCAPTPENPLRVRCSSDHPATLTLTAPDAPTRIATGVDPVAWGLLPDTEYTWTLGADSGTVRTGSPEGPLGAPAFTVTGTPPEAFDAVLLAVDCGSPVLVILDGHGRLLWYDDTLPFASPRHGYHWADGVIWALGDDVLVGQTPTGETVARYEQGVDFDGTLHHDLTVWQGRTYVLFEEPHPVADVDGVHVFADGVLQASMRLSDHFAITEPDPEASPGPGSGEWAHANGLTVSPEGDLVLSLLNFDSVLALGGEPDAPDYLAPRWLAVGSDRGLPEADFAPGDDTAGFMAQHNATRRGDQLWLFDNLGDPLTSRAERYRLDSDAGTLDLEVSWDLGLSCPVQGGAVPVDDGVLASCTLASRVHWFVEGEPEPRWTLQAQCDTASRGVMTRALPVWL